MSFFTYHLPIHTSFNMCIQIPFTYIAVLENRNIEISNGSANDLQKNIDLWNQYINKNITYFQSRNESFYLEDTYKIRVRFLAHLIIGELSGDWGINGSYWSFAPTGSLNLGDWTDSDVQIYASHLHIRNNSYILFRLTSTTYIKNSILSSEGNGYFFFNTALGGIVDLQSVYINNVTIGLYLANPADTCEDVHLHDSNIGIYSNAAGIEARNVRITSVNTEVYTAANGSTVAVIDPYENLTVVQNNNADNWIEERYSCNIHVTDKDGVNVNGATVACEDQFGTPVFSVNTVFLSSVIAV